MWNMFCVRDVVGMIEMDFDQSKNQTVLFLKKSNGPSLNKHCHIHIHLSHSYKYSMCTVWIWRGLNIQTNEWMNECIQFSPKINVMNKQSEGKKKWKKTTEIAFRNTSISVFFLWMFCECVVWRHCCTNTYGEVGALRASCAICFRIQATLLLIRIASFTTLHTLIFGRTLSLYEKLPRNFTKNNYWFFSWDERHMLSVRIKNQTWFGFAKKVRWTKKKHTNLLLAIEHFIPELSNEDVWIENWHKSRERMCCVCLWARQNWLAFFD